MCLLKITEPVCERIFEQTKHRMAIVLASELTVLNYLNISSVIPRGKRQFYPANWFWENHKSLFIAEPCSDFNRCFGKRKMYTIYSSLFVILKHCIQ